MTSDDRTEVIDHALARHTLTKLRNIETKQVAFRKGLVKLGRICGYEILDRRFGTDPVTIQTPLAEMTGEEIPGMDDVVIINILRAATPFVEGLLKAFPRAQQGVISASREESARNEDGTFPITVDYEKLPTIEDDEVVIIADPMLATGSTMITVLERIQTVANGDPTVIVLSAVSAPTGIERVTDEFDVDLLTVAIDDYLDEDGYIVPGLGDAGDRAFRTD